MRPRYIGIGIIAMGVVVAFLGAPDGATPAGTGWGRENLGVGVVLAVVGVAIYAGLAIWENRRAKRHGP